MDDLATTYRAMSVTMPADATAAVAWAWCPACWGQGRLSEDRNGEGLVPHPCPARLGLGEHVGPRRSWTGPPPGRE